MSIINKGDFIENLNQREFDTGCIKFNIPNPEDIYSTNGEGVWGWITNEDKEKWIDDTYEGKITAILCNSPLNYSGKLFWGAEVVLQCHGNNRPTLDPEWVKENLLEDE